LASSILVFNPEIMPATWGHAILVPVMIAVAVFEPKALVDTIPVPGAQMSMQSLTVIVGMWIKGKKPSEAERTAGI
jgi:hypothetical protein